MPRSTVRPALLGALAVVLLAPLAPASAQETTPAPSPSSSYQPRPYDPTTAPEPTDSSAPGSPTPEPTATPTGPAPSPTPAPTGDPVLRMSVSTTTVRGAGSLRVSGRLYAAPGVPASGARLDVLGRLPGSASWARLGSMTTDGSGLAALVLVPRVSREYAVRTAAAPVLQTAAQVVRVQPVLTAALTPRVTEVGRTGVVTGRLAPAYAGARVLVQRRSSTGWTTLRTAVPDSTGLYRATLSADPLGRHVYRAYLAAQPAHLAAAGPLLERVVEGRTLRAGDRGPDVLALQQRLAAQKADVGALDGVFGYDLRHAVTAFQKSQGLPRTGVYDKATSARLASPRPVVLRYPARGRAVEVDLAKQVLYVSEGGRLTRIVDVSTGNDALYESDGVTYKAFTPTGRFSITRKIDGVRVSRLGELYRPAYFHQGWAVHGSPSVPVYPASHGCVRVTNGSMDRLYGLLTVGTPVTVYRG